MRDQYLSLRRELRARPDPEFSWRRIKRKYKDDLKHDTDMGVIEMNDYDTQALHIPYGPGWHARRIEKLVYQTVSYSVMRLLSKLMMILQDLSMNCRFSYPSCWSSTEACTAPFNPKNKDRRLHRHPAFFGTMEECLNDCCEVGDCCYSYLFCLLTLNSTALRAT